MSSTITRITLPDGTPVLARISEAEQVAPPGARRSPEQEAGGTGERGSVPQAGQGPGAEGHARGHVPHTGHSGHTGHVSRTGYTGYTGYTEQADPVGQAEQDGAQAAHGGYPDGYADTGFRAPRPPGTTRLESWRGLITGVAASVAEGLRAARPDEVSVSFGIELTARAGKVVSLLADGEAKGTISVTLTWRGGPPAEPGTTEGTGEHGGRTGGGHGPL